MIHDDSSDYPAVKMGMPFSGFALRTKGRRPLIVPELKDLKKVFVLQPDRNVEQLLGDRLMDPLNDTLMDPPSMAGVRVRKGVFMIQRKKVFSARHYSKGGVSMKLSLAQIRQIQEYLEQGISIRKMATLCQVGRNTVRRYQRNSHRSRILVV